MIKESIGQSLIIRFLLSQQKPFKLVRLYNSVPYSKKLGRYIRRSNSLVPKGLPDLVYFYKGKTFFFEVKTEKASRFIVKNYNRILEGKGKIYEHIYNQIVFREDLIKIGITCEFVATVEQVKEILEVHCGRGEG